MSGEKTEKRTTNTPLFRVSYAKVFEPEVSEKKDKDGNVVKDKDGNVVKIYRFSLTGIFEHKEFAWEGRNIVGVSEPAKDMIRLIQEAKKAKWPNLSVVPNFKHPIREGVADVFDLNKYPEYEGKWICSMKMTTQFDNRGPGVVDIRRAPIVNRDDFYSGCYAIANINAYAYDNESKGVSFGLNHVMKMGDGEKLVNTVSAEDAFAEIDPSKYGFDNSHLLASGAQSDCGI